MSSGPTPTRWPRRHLRLNTRTRAQPRLGVPEVTSQVTNEPNSLSTLEASGRLLQHNSATGFSELPDKISTAWIEQFLSPVNGTCLRSMELVSGQRTYLQLTDQAVTTNRASGYHIELLQLRPTVQIKQLSRVILSCINISPSPTRGGWITKILAH